ncbi:uncharacterized protein [Palaemon carinicauda]|uniref:uncharacterized protein isoform X1 n=1 Tax=Palaemon carinicauda TaxID=392227 RepID=UPI0035B58D0F
MEVGAKVSSLDTVNATNKKIQIKNAKKDKFECGAKSKRKAKSKLYQENEYLLVPHEERSGNMNITEHIVNKESKNLSKGLVNQRQLAHNEIVPKYASEVSPLSPDTESHYLGNKNFKFLHKSGKSTEIMNVYKRFLASVGLNEYTLRNISGVYNLRNLQLEKQSPEINILESINLKGQLKENTDLMLERRESDLPSQNMNAASPKNSGSAKFSQHFEDMCSKEDGYGAEGWFWWFGEGWVDLWIWTSNLLDEILPPELLDRTSLPEAGNQKSTFNNEVQSTNATDNSLNLHSALQEPAKSPKE